MGTLETERSQELKSTGAASVLNVESGTGVL